MRIHSSFALIVLPLAGALTLTGCPGPESGSSGGWTSDSCYCDETGCTDYNGNTCSGTSSGSPSASGGTSGASGGTSGASGGTSGASGGTSGASGGSSGEGGSSGQTASGGTSSGSSGSSGGDLDGGPSSSSGGSSSGAIDAGPAPICTPATVATDCLANQICSGGYCRFQCTSDAQCKLIDNRLSCEQGICGAF